MSPAIKERATPILQKSGKLGEILEAVRIATYFNYINTLSNVYGLRNL